MANSPDFQKVFASLKPILENYASRLLVKIDQPTNYSLDAPMTGKYKKEMFFGSVNIQKNYVSFHLMPVYVHPELLDNISFDLKKRMQGKSCFNFKSIDQKTLDELTGLAERGYIAYMEDGLLD